VPYGRRFADPLPCHKELIHYLDIDDDICEVDYICITVILVTPHILAPILLVSLSPLQVQAQEHVSKV
jgi:hypothetical protein